ncbi:hypothetical protein RIVM261_016930 [Rivularia sp. IAM M-261]|nr:hypothetical protein CAL7716_030660 [Calothrix sp. PCC 7716]GJD16737.1 hypothetical protein RIVM261_016930 [Rivularia sp. IAM M-261]
MRVKQDEVDVEKMQVYLDLYPLEDQEYLPPSLHVMILDEDSASVIEAKAKNDSTKVERRRWGAF